MKIGIAYKPTAGGFLRYGENDYKKIKSFGYDAIDLSLAETESPIYAQDDAAFEQWALRQKALIAEAGLVLSQVHGPWRWPPQDSTPEDRRERMEKMKRSLWITRLLGCKHWVVHPIMPFGTKDPESDEGQKTWELNLSFMTELLAYAKEQDIIICLENMPMPQFSLGAPADVLRVAQALNDEHFKLCLDTGHLLRIPNLSVGKTVRELKGELKVLHVHDNMGDHDRHLWPTQGILDWSEFVSALREIGFDGVFSLETAPSADLNDADFEAACKELYGIAARIVSGEYISKETNV